MVACSIAALAASWSAMAVTAAPRIPGIRSEMDHLVASLVNPDPLYAHTLKGEGQNASGNPGDHPLHEQLLPENTAFYFEEFAQHAAAHNLRFLPNPA